MRLLLMASLLSDESMDRASLPNGAKLLYAGLGFPRHWLKIGLAHWDRLTT